MKPPRSPNLKRSWCGTKSLMLVSVSWEELQWMKPVETSLSMNLPFQGCAVLCESHWDLINIWLCLISSVTKATSPCAAPTETPTRTNATGDRRPANSRDSSPACQTGPAPLVSLPGSRQGPRNNVISTVDVRLVCPLSHDAHWWDGVSLLTRSNIPNLSSSHFHGEY